MTLRDHRRSVSSKLVPRVLTTCCYFVCMCVCSYPVYCCRCFSTLIPSTLFPKNLDAVLKGLILLIVCCLFLTKMSCMRVCSNTYAAVACCKRRSVYSKSVACCERRYVCSKYYAVLYILLTNMCCVYICASALNPFAAANKDPH